MIDAAVPVATTPSPIQAQPSSLALMSTHRIGGTPARANSVDLFNAEVVTRSGSYLQRAGLLKSPAQPAVVRRLEADLEQVEPDNGPTNLTATDCELLQDPHGIVDIATVPPMPTVTQPACNEPVNSVGTGATATTAPPKLFTRTRPVPSKPAATAPQHARAAQAQSKPLHSGHSQTGLTGFEQESSSSNSTLPIAHMSNRRSLAL